MRAISLWTLMVELDSGGELLKPALACGLVAQICEGLAALHARGRADGALSPSRLAVTPRGGVAIVELGARRRAPASMYCAPEQLMVGAIGPRTDVYALGLVLHDLTRGTRPMHDRIGALALAELTIDRLPLPVAEVIRCALATDPRDRFATARELAVALRDAGDAWGGTFERADIAAWLAARQARRAARANAEHATEPTHARTALLRQPFGRRANGAPAVLGACALVAFIAMVITAAIPTGMASVMARAQQPAQRRHQPLDRTGGGDAHAQLRHHLAGLLQ